MGCLRQGDCLGTQKGLIVVQKLAEKLLIGSDLEILQKFEQVPTTVSDFE